MQLADVAEHIFLSFIFSMARPCNVHPDAGAAGEEASAAGRLCLEVHRDELRCGPVTPGRPQVHNAARQPRTVRCAAVVKRASRCHLLHFLWGCMGLRCWERTAQVGRAERLLAWSSCIVRMALDTKTQRRLCTQFFYYVKRGNRGSLARRLMGGRHRPSQEDCACQAHRASPLKAADILLLPAPSPPGTCLNPALPCPALKPQCHLQ
jgi:hypothetical protein